MQIRRATPADVDAVVALVESAYRGDSSRAGWTTEADLLDGQRTDRDEVRSVLEELVVAQDEAGELVGCCTLIPKDGHAYFGMFAVRPGLQGGGVGSQLLKEAETLAAEHGASYVEMTVISTRSELIDFYLRRGYADTGETRPFPYGDDRFGQPRRDDLAFTVLVKDL
ncbi:MAG: Acetyltransferase family protein [Frankiales bacterium]|nr:Acetyltransferase family protein [Frankiales bacterium]